MFDLVNAGPRHRFAVSGLIAHNCNFALIFGQSGRGFREYADAVYGVQYSDEEARRIEKRLEDLGYF